MERKGRKMTTVLQSGAGIAFLLLGVWMLISKEAAATYKRFGFSKWFRLIIGVLQVLGAVLLFIGTGNLLLGAAVAFLLAVMMGYVAVMQLKLSKGSMAGVLPSVVLTMICLVIVSMNGMSL